MDSQFNATREELYNVQMDVKHVQAIQLSHADRLLRLEKRQADDAALKSVWSSTPPFPGILSGTPQQGPVQSSANEVFEDFDDEEGQNLLGSLHLEADEEPVRRGASRANSVRFDVSALQGSNWATGSRNSGDFGPLRPNSGFGSHPMTERSLSHKSDGRHSSAGHSVHSLSGRTSSLGLDTNFMIGGQDDEVHLDISDPPPGLGILGSVPSIIRCWLTTNFSHNALLYAAVCSGSQKSIIDFALVKDLGLVDHMQKDHSGRRSIRLPVYLPEAIITHSTSRSNSPASQLPCLSTDFEVLGISQRATTMNRKCIHIFVGSDTLRAHNADILFSQNLMMVYGDDRNKLSVPFVRPEDEAVFKYLCTTYVVPERIELKATAPSFTPTESKPKVDFTPNAVTMALSNGNGTEEDNKFATGKEIQVNNQGDVLSPTEFIASANRQRAESLKSGKTVANGHATEIEKHTSRDRSALESETPGAVVSDTARRDSSSGIWGSWRQANSLGNGVENETVSGYQRATRGGSRSMKVLKPSSKSTNTGLLATAPSRSTSRTGAAYEVGSVRPLGESKKPGQTEKQENSPHRWDPKRLSLEESKTIPTFPRSSNPIGGASAFAWMNGGKGKTTNLSAE